MRYSLHKKLNKEKTVYGLYFIVLYIIIKFILSIFKDYRAGQQERINWELYLLAKEYHHNQVDIFNEWQVRNPGVYISQSPYARFLVWNMINSYLKMFEYCPHIPIDEKKLNRLYALLDDKPKPPSRKTFPSTQKPAPVMQVFSYTHPRRSLYISKHANSCE